MASATSGFSKTYLLLRSSSSSASDEYSSGPGFNSRLGPVSSILMNLRRVVYVSGRYLGS